MSNPFLHEPDKGDKNVFAEIIEALIIALVFNIVIYFLFVIPSQVDGPSMLPNLHDKELLFANKMPSWFYGDVDTLNKLGWDYDYGDIVIFDYSNIVLVKRVIAKAGDSVMISTEGDVYVNGNKRYEDYLPANLKTFLPAKGLRAFEPDIEVIVPDGSFFLMGDNRANSKDGRFADVGFVKREAIKGVVFFRFWPLDKIGVMAKPTYQIQ